MVVRSKISYAFTLFLSLWFFLACGRSGSDGSSSLEFGGSLLQGNIGVQTGTASALEGWTIGLLNAKNGDMRLSSVGADGDFSFSSVTGDGEYTIMLFNTDMRLSAMLSVVSPSTTGAVQQYFGLRQSNLGNLVLRGKSINLTDTSVVQMLSYTARDSDGNGIPDGLEDTLESDDANAALNLTGLSELNAGTESADYSLAKLTSTVKGPAFDLDGDGLPNWFDDDDNGNGVIDVFELDANSDMIEDAYQKKGDGYFSDGVEFFTGQLMYRDDGSMYLKFGLKLTPGARRPESIKIRGSTKFLKNARVVGRGSSGSDELKGLWEGKLYDDGKNFDNAADDGFYSVKLKLSGAPTLKSRQAIFASLKYSEDQVRELPFTFPQVNIDEISFNYVSATRRILIGGNPFGAAEQGYLWFAHVFSIDGILAHSTPLIEASIGRYTIPEEDFDAQSTYSARVYGQSLEKIIGFPVFVVESERKILSN